jgi:hypothetical protein
MARTLQGMVLDLTLDERRAEVHGGLLFATGQRARLHWARLSSGEGEVWDDELREVYGDRMTLRPTAVFSSRYTTGTTGVAYFATYLRTVPQAKQWAALELLYRQPAGTSATFLLGNAAGQARRWNGTAWATVSTLSVAANWNSAAQLVAGFPSWTGTALRVYFRLQTSSATATPVVYGARAMVRVHGPSPEEELVHRTLLPWLAQLQVPVRYRCLANGTSSVSLAQLDEYRLDDESGASALTVTSVHNLTRDAAEATELLASWNPATHVATLAAAQTTGDTLQLDLVVRPLAARMTSQDYLELSRLPAVVLEQVRLLPEGQAHGVHGRTLVRSTATLSARRVPTPQPLAATFQLRLVAQYDVDLHRLIAVLEQAASSASSSHPQSAITGERMRLRRLSGEWSEQDGGLAATAMWEARGLQAYRAADEAVPLLGTISVDPQEVTVG